MTENIELFCADVTLDYTQGVTVEIALPPMSSWGENPFPTYGFKLRKGAQIILRHKTLKVEIRIDSDGFTVVPFKKEEKDG